ncbi:MAG: methyltransferase [Planctomycetes bacterium]|nr:methyltransferase [Planctomycetota bacterium]
MIDRSSIYRERIALTLEHKPVDRCPVDLGGTPQSTVETPAGVERLARHLGFHGPAPKEYDKFDTRILEHFDVDFRRAGAMVTFETPRKKKISDTVQVTSLGLKLQFSGQYWEIVDGPLHNSTRDDVAAFEFPGVEDITPGLLDDVESRARSLCLDTPYVVFGEHPVYGVLELACWLAGYDHVMLMLGLDPEYIHLLFGKILEFQKAVIAAYYGRIGRYIHITTSGDDFGTQTGPFMSPAMWRQFVKPYMKERIEYTRRFTDAVYMHHSCGSIFDIIPDLAEIGVGILNPIQPGAARMDPAELKNSFGGIISFHGGLDTQHVLPSGDPAAIDAAVGNLMDAMRPAETGGFIFAAAHNIQDDVAPASIERMLAAARTRPPARGLRH